MNRQVIIAELDKMLAGLITWKDATVPHLAERGARALEGLADDEWRVLVVAWPLSTTTPGSRGIAGTATHFKTMRVINLPRELAERAYKLAEEQCPAKNKP